MPIERVETVQVVSTTGCGDYICSKAGLLKIFVLLCSCATVAIYAFSERYIFLYIKIYALIAQIVSTGVSLLIFFFKVTGLHLQCNPTCCWSFDSFDYFWSWISCLNFLSCSVILACFFNCDPAICRGSFCSCVQELTALLLGALTAIVYKFEARNLQEFAPIGTSYGTSWRGIWRMFVLVVGGAAFGLLIETGYSVCETGSKSGCTSARTFVLIAWTAVWSVSALQYLLHVFGFQTKTTENGHYKFSAIEFFWSAFSSLIYLIGAAVLAGFLSCSQFQTFRCRARLSSDICGFVSALLFAVDAHQMRADRPVWLVRTTVPPPAQSEHVHNVRRTTETRIVQKHSKN